MIYIVLLKAVNVSGKNKILMKEFCLYLLKHPNINKVTSYIQSGNFIIDSNLQTTIDITNIISNTIQNYYNYNIKIFTYSLNEFHNIINYHPFNIIDKKNYISFTSGNFNNLETFKRLDFKNDQYFIKEKIIHIYYSQQYSKSKLNNGLIEKKLKTTATTRNWNTLQKLLQLATNQKTLQ